MAFSWSYSKYKAYDVCPRRHYEVDIQKNFVDDTEQLKWGNQVHKAMADAALGKSDLPDSMKDYQRWIDKYASPGLPGELKVELKYAVTKDFEPTAWFARNVWFRGVCDLQRISGPVAVAIDWKTGKVLHDSRQLMLMAQCIFVHYPEVQRVLTEFVWLKDDCTTPETFNRNTIMNGWPPILDHVKQMESAAQTLSYPPKPGKLCARYCPVSTCQYHGKRHT